MSMFDATVVAWTTWYRWVPASEGTSAHWGLNHTEIGHVVADRPQPKSPDFHEQNDWVNGTWRYEHVWRYRDGTAAA